MKIKKFIGASMSDCLVQVKAELGENAVILDSRKMPRKGPFGFLFPPRVEVTASTPDRNLTPRRQRRDWARLAQTATDLATTVPGQQLSQPISAEEFTALAAEIGALKESVGKLSYQLKFNQLPGIPEKLRALHRDLLDNGVEARLAEIITREVGAELGDRMGADYLQLVHLLRERIGRFVRAIPCCATEQRAYVIALVGPTGVGKTTTLAKMATNPEIFGRKRVALVSTDTYRIAAVEQLKTFASIAGIPMEAVYRPADIRGAIERFGDRDVILIDTAGRSQNDRGQLNDLTIFLQYAQPDEVHLLLSVTTRLQDQLDIIAKFKALKPDRFVFTKLDETTSVGMILNVCFHTRWPVALLTYGQNVPDDIIAPSQMQLERLISERAYLRRFLLKGAIAALECR